jgi:hypothetical protein
MNEKIVSSRAERLLKRGLPTAIALGGCATFGISQGVAAFEHQTTECTPSTEHVTVQPGDTMWDIANLYSPDMDTRDAVLAITHNNPAAVDRAGEIHPGTTLSIDVCLPDVDAK